MWLNRIKDDRIRLTELNRGYMAERGWEIVGEPCKGTACGRRGCPLYKRRAQKLATKSPLQESLEWFNNLPTPQVN